MISFEEYCGIRTQLSGLQASGGWALVKKQLQESIEEDTKQLRTIDKTGEANKVKYTDNDLIRVNIELLEALLDLPKTLDERYHAQVKDEPADGFLETEKLLNISEAT